MMEFLDLVCCGYKLVGIVNFHDIFSSVVVNGGEERFLRFTLRSYCRVIFTSDIFRYIRSVENMNGSTALVYRYWYVWIGIFIPIQFHDENGFQDNIVGFFFFFLFPFRVVDFGP